MINKVISELTIIDINRAIGRIKNPFIKVLKHKIKNEMENN